MNVPLWDILGLDYEKGIGCDFVGVVLKAGESAEFTEGDKVSGLRMSQGKPGTVADVLVVDMANATVLKKPTDWGWNQAAALPASMAYSQDMYRLCGTVNDQHQGTCGARWEFSNGHVHGLSRQEKKLESCGKLFQPKRRIRKERGRR